MRAPSQFEYPQFSSKSSNSHLPPFISAPNTKDQFSEPPIFLNNLMNSARQQPTLASAFSSLSYDSSYATAARPPQVPHACPNADSRYALSPIALTSTQVHPSRVANGLLQAAAPLEPKKRLSFVEPGGHADEGHRPASFIGGMSSNWASQWSGSDGLDTSGRLHECVSGVVRHGLDDSFNLSSGNLFPRSLRAQPDLETACEARESDHEGSEASQMCFPLASTSTGPLHLNLDGYEEIAADQSPLSTPNDQLRRESVSGRASFGSQDLGYRSLDELGSTPVNTHAAYYAALGGGFEAGARNTRLGSFHSNCSYTSTHTHPQCVPAMACDRSGTGALLARDLSGETDPLDAYHYEYSSSLSSETAPPAAGDSRSTSRAQRPGERFDLRTRTNGTGVWNSRLLPTYLFDEATEDDIRRHSSSLVSDSCASDAAASANELLTPLGDTYSDERAASASSASAGNANARSSQRHHADSWNGPIGEQQQQQQQQPKPSPLVASGTSLSPAGEYMEDPMLMTPTRTSTSASARTFSTLRAPPRQQLQSTDSDTDTTRTLTKQSSSTSASTTGSAFGRPRASAPEFVPSAATLAASHSRTSDEPTAPPAASSGVPRAPTAASASTGSSRAMGASTSTSTSNKASAVPALKPLTGPMPMAPLPTPMLPMPMPTPMSTSAGAGPSVFVPVGLSPEQYPFYYAYLSAILNSPLQTPAAAFDLQQYLLGLNLALTTGSFGGPLPLPLPGVPMQMQMPPVVPTPMLPPNLAGLHLNLPMPASTSSPARPTAGSSASRQQPSAARTSHAGANANANANGGGLKEASRGHQHQSKARSEAANELHMRLEECCEQFKLLEKERKKAEAELARQNPGKQMSTVDPLEGRVCVGGGGGDALALASSQLPRMPANPSRVDRHVHDSLKEHSMVIELLAKMDRLRSGGSDGGGLPARIRSAMERWLEGIRKLQARRKEEVINTANRQRSQQARLQSTSSSSGALARTGGGDERDLLALTQAIVELCEHTRAARTALWTALQLTIASRLLTLFDVADRSFGAIPSSSSSSWFGFTPLAAGSGSSSFKRASNPN